MRSLALLLAGTPLLLAPSPAQCQSFAIVLKLQAGKVSQTAQTDTTAPGTEPKERKVIEAKAGTLITVNWQLSNASKTSMKNILVHFFAVKEDMVNQKVVPKLTKEVTAESAMTMDFEPSDKAKGSLTFTIDRTGVFLIRLETIGAPSGEDCHAALDLIIK